MSLQDRVRAFADRPLPDRLQGVSKEKIRVVLRSLDRESDDMVDTVFALLDNESPSLFPAAAAGLRFSDGASTQHIAAHIGILQRGGTRLDREGRDYWIKPLRDLAAVEPVYLSPESGSFVLGHPVPKSPNSAYRLVQSFVEVLTAPEHRWRTLLEDWVQADNVRARLRQQAEMAALARSAVDTKHSDLIDACCKYYAPAFLPAYEVLYIDVGDGDRITEAQRRKLLEAGLEIRLEDSMPDVLLWNRKADALWIIEAVTSDGEVDLHKVAKLTELAERANKKDIGFTTAYQTWKVAAARQSSHKNLPPGTYLWIMEDATKHFLAIEQTGTKRGGRS